MTGRTHLCVCIAMLGLMSACDSSSPASESGAVVLSSGQGQEKPRLSNTPVAAQLRVVSEMRAPASVVAQNRAAVRYAALDMAPAARPRANDSDADAKARKSEAETEAKKEATANLAGNDRNFIQRIGNDGQSDEQAALYVANKTLNSEIRSYAAKVGRDHGKANQQLRKQAAQRGIEIPADPEGILSARLDRLRQIAGVQMDRTFLQDFGVQAHMDMIALFEVQASQSQDKELRAFAAERLPVLRQHYKEAVALQEKHTPAPVRREM